MSNLSRKEVSLDEETIAMLEFQAAKQGRKLKNYMEFVLKEQADNYQLSEEYKREMDVTLDKFEKGELNFIPKEAFFDKLDMNDV